MDLPLDYTSCNPIAKDFPFKTDCLRFTSRPKTDRPISNTDFSIRLVASDGYCVEQIRK